MIQRITLFMKKFWFRITFFTIGLGSLIWFLIRVIPKPSRINYPCMKATTPLAYSFVAYLLSLGTFTFVMKKARERFKQARYVLATMFVLVGLAAGIIALMNNDWRIFAATADFQDPQAGNQPIGIAKGIFPGRVVWEHNTNATNENYVYSSGNSWQDDENTNQAVVNSMLSNSLQNLTGTTSDADAWDAIFHYYNNSHGRGIVGYETGEKIVIKLNLNGGGGGPNDANINTSPHLAHALLDQLINVVGVAEADIHIGDPNCQMYDSYYYTLSSGFENANYWGYGAGRIEPVQSSSPVLKYSDGKLEHYIPQSYVDATYLINVPVFKKHHRAGISLCSKNHFGTIAPFDGGAWRVHYSLPYPEEFPGNPSGDEPPQLSYGVYRCFVDIMGHKDIGGKTILYLVDAIWGSINWGHPPIKYRMPPFGDGTTVENGDWPNSLFLSQDPVAIESVCYDFLYHEFDLDHPTEGEDDLDADHGPYSRFSAADDFLHQAADPSEWAVQYDPEGDGSVLVSMGTHEHWNNAIDKQYTRNLGTGNGIDLASPYVVSVVTPVDEVEYAAEGFELSSNYPNPFSESTTISYRLAIPSVVYLKIFNTNGQVVKQVYFNERMVGNYSYVWDGTGNSGSPVPGGTYICKITVHNARGSFDMNNKMVVMR